jgi:hypothetical protein
MGDLPKGRFLPAGKGTKKVVLFYSLGLPLSNPLCDNPAILEDS